MGLRERSYEVSAEKLGSDGREDAAHRCEAIDQLDRQEHLIMEGIEYKKTGDVFEEVQLGVLVGEFRPESEPCGY